MVVLQKGVGPFGTRNACTGSNHGVLIVLRNYSGTTDVNITQALKICNMR